MDLVNIEGLRGVHRSHETKSKVHPRGLPMHIQKIFYDIIMSDLRANPRKLRERLEEKGKRVLPRARRGGSC